MKILFIALTFLICSVSRADYPIFPEIMNWGTSAYVRIYNHTNDNVHCSGWLDIYTADGGHSGEYYNEYIYAGMTSFRTLYPRSLSRVTRVTHSITCY